MVVFSSLKLVLCWRLRSKSHGLLFLSPVHKPGWVGGGVPTAHTGTGVKINSPVGDLLDEQWRENLCGGFFS